MKAGQWVLVVDDDEAIRATISELLRAEGYGVACAANGEQALESLERRPRPCVVLLDLMMPVMNGWEFLDALERRGTLGHLPVIVVSAMSSDAVPAAASMHKPVEVDLLMHAIARFCN